MEKNGVVDTEKVKAMPTGLRFFKKPRISAVSLPACDWANPSLPLGTSDQMESQRVSSVRLCSNTGSGNSSEFVKVVRTEGLSIPMPHTFTDSTVSTLKAAGECLLPAIDEKLRKDLGYAQLNVSDSEKRNGNAHSPTMSLQATGVSESGWTTYLDQSAEWRATNEMFNASSSHQNRVREDPSMASDASSGPEQRCSRLDSGENLESRSILDPQSFFRHEIGNNPFEDTCQSNISCESSSEGMKRSSKQQRKKRKMGAHGGVNACAERGLQCLLQVEDGGLTDENQWPDPDLEDDGTSRFDRDTQEDVHHRLELLQHLIPNGHNLDEEAMLEVAIDYVKSLEMKIKMFEATGISKEGIELRHLAVSAGCGFCSPGILHEKFFEDANALQDKGLCLIPLSALAEGV